MSVVQAGIHVVDVVVGVAAVSEPSAFTQVKASSIVQGRPRLELPTDIVEELGGDEAALTEITLVGAIQSPAVVVNVLNLLIRDLKEGNAVLKPGSIVAKVLAAECLSVKGGKDDPACQGGKGDGGDPHCDCACLNADLEAAIPGRHPDICTCPSVTILPETRSDCHIP